MLSEKQRDDVRAVVEALVNRDEASRLLGEPAVAETVARSIEVLGSREKALRWLKTPLESLGDNTPGMLLETVEGISQVETLLGQMEYGVW